MNVDFWHISNVLIGVVEISLALMITEACYKKTTLKSKYRFLSIFVTFILLNIIELYLNIPILKFPIVLGITLINMKLRYKLPLRKFIAILTMWCLVIAVSDSFVMNTWSSYLLANGLNSTQYYTIHILMGILSKVIGIMIVHCYYRILRIKEIPFAMKQLLLHLSPVITILLIHIMIKTCTATYISSNDSIMIIFVSMGLLVSNIYTWQIFEDAIRGDREKRNYMYLQTKMKEKYKYYLNMEKNQEEMRKLWHDMHNHLRCIEELIQQSHIEDAKDYLKQVNQTMTHANGGIRTGNFIVDVILNEKYQMAIENQITMKTQVNGELLDFMEDIDVCTIYGNLLDNAIEACMKVHVSKSDIKPIIYVQTTKIRGVTVIRVSNTYITPIQEKDGKILTTKQDASIHGIGLENIKSIAHNYEGEVHITHENGYFDVQVIF